MFLLLFINLFYFPHFSYSFKSDFQYFDRVFLNSTSFNLKLTYDVAQLENTSSAFIHSCSDINNELLKVKAQLENLQEHKPEVKYIVNTDRLNFTQAQTACLHTSVSCHLATISETTSARDLANRLEKHNIKNAYIAYSTIDGILTSLNEPLSDKHPINNEPIHVKSCPPSFTLHDSKCIHYATQIPKGLSYESAIRYCDNLNAKLFSPRSDSDLAFLNSIPTDKFQYSIKYDINEFWLNGTFHDEYPQISYCYDYSPYGTHISYDSRNQCFMPVKVGYNNRGIMCHIKSDFTSPPQDKSPKLSRRVKQHFFSSQGAISVDHMGKLTLAYASDRLPYLCQCSTNVYFNQVQDSFKRHLVTKLTSAMSSISSKCDSILKPMQNSPYIVTSSDLPPFHQSDIQSQSIREKRSLSALVPIAVPLVQAAFKATGGSLLKSSFLDGPIKSLMSILHKSASSAPSAIGQIRESLTHSQYDIDYQNRLLTNIKMLRNQLSTTIMNRRLPAEVLRSLQQRQLVANNYVANITETLTLTSTLSGANTIIDNLLLRNNEMALAVQSNFRSYQKLMQTIISQVPINDPVLNRHILDSLIKLPRGFSFLHSSLYDILSSASVSYEINDNLLTVNLFLPVIQNDMVLYVYKGTSLPYLTGSGLPVQPKFESVYIAVSSDKSKYALFSPSDLLPCKYKDTYICNNAKLYKRNEVSTCIYAHFIDDPLSAQKNCFYYQLTVPHFELTSDHKLHYFSPYPTTALFTCSDGHPYSHSSEILSGTSVLKVPDGCSVDVNGFVGINPHIPVAALVPNSAKPAVTSIEKILELPPDSSFLDEVYVQATPMAKRSSSYSLNKTGELLLISLGCILLILLISCFSIVIVRLRLHKPEAKHTSLTDPKQISAEKPILKHSAPKVSIQTGHNTTSDDLPDISSDKLTNDLPSDTITISHTNTPPMRRIPHRSNAFKYHSHQPIPPSTNTKYFETSQLYL